MQGDWPSPGSRFFHSIGVGPFTVRDHTRVLESEFNVRLVLEARVRPFLTASVTVTLTPTPTGSDVVMEEHPIRPFAVRVLRPLLDPLTSRRNMAALERLKGLVERRTRD